MTLISITLMIRSRRSRLVCCSITAEKEDREREGEGGRGSSQPGRGSAARGSMIAAVVRAGKDASAERLVHVLELATLVVHVFEGAVADDQFLAGCFGHADHLDTVIGGKEAVVVLFRDLAVLDVRRVLRVDRVVATDVRPVA